MSFLRRTAALAAISACLLATTATAALASEQPPSGSKQIKAVGAVDLAPFPPAPTKAPTLSASSYSTITVTIAAITTLPAGTAPLTGYHVRFTPALAGYGDPIVVPTSTSSLKVTGVGLQNGIVYNIDYAAVNEVNGSEVEGPYGPNLSTSPLGAPAPAGVHVTAEGNHLVTLDWDDVAEATKYTVFYQPTDGSAAEKSLSTAVATGTAPAPSTLKVTGLTNAAEYTLSVAATSLVNGVSKLGDRSAIVHATPVSPPAPSDLRVTGIGSSKAYLDWNPVPGAESYYLKAEVLDANGVPAPAVPAAVKIATTATATQKVISGLTNGVDYRVRVATGKDAVAGDYTNDASSVTATPAAVPGTTNPTKVAVAPTSISIKWVAPTAVSGVDPADRYRVTYTPSNGGAAIVHDEVGTLSDTATGLVTGVTYTISIQAGNAAGYGMGSTTPLVLVASDKPGAVRNPSVDRSVDGTVAGISWDTPDYTGGTSIKSYTVTPKQTNPVGTAPAAKTVTSGNFVNFTGLVAGADYTFTITATTDAGVGASVIVGSLAVRPDIVSDAAYDYDTNSVSFTWNKGDNPRLSYQAQATQIPFGASSTTIVLPATQTCDATSCTAVFDKFADNINGEYWSFRVRTTDNVYSTSGWSMAQVTPVASASSNTQVQSVPAAQCPAGTQTIGDSCRETLPYTYHTEDRYVECAGQDCPGSTFNYTPYPCSYGTAHPDGCYWWSVGHKWITVVVKDAPPYGFSDNGSEYYRDTPLTQYDVFSIVSTFPWTSDQRQARGVVNMLVNGSQAAGQSASLGRCPGTVDVAFQGLAGASRAAYSLCN